MLPRSWGGVPGAIRERKDSEKERFWSSRSAANANWPELVLIHTREGPHPTGVYVYLNKHAHLTYLWGMAHRTYLWTSAHRKRANVDVLVRTFYAIFRPAKVFGEKKGRKRTNFGATCVSQLSNAIALKTYEISTKNLKKIFFFARRVSDALMRMAQKGRFRARTRKVEN